MKDYDVLFAEGQFAGSRFLTAKSWAIDLQKFPKRNYQADDLLIGFLVSKKVDKRAVVRNRLKRQLREIVRLFLKENKIKPGRLLAVVAKPEAKAATYQELQAEVQALLKRLKVWYE